MGNYIDFGVAFELIDRAKRLTEEGAWMFSLSHSDVQEEIIRLNQEQLYEEGIRSDGSDLGVYQPFTITRKREKGQRYDHVTLRDTGEFYASFRIYYDEDSYTVDGNGQKDDKNLFDVYGEDILGLTSFNMERIKQVILQYYAEYIDQGLYNGY